MLQSERSPLRIASLDLRDFRGIGRLSLSFLGADGNPVSPVLLVGANATGKSSVLEAIALLLGATRVEYETASAQEGLVRFGARDFQLHAGVYYETHQDKTRRIFDLNLDRQRLAQYVGAPQRPPMPGRVTVMSDHATGVASLAPEVQWFRASTEVEASSLKDLSRRLVNAAYGRHLAPPNADAVAADPFERVQRAWQVFEHFESNLDVLRETNNPGSDYLLVVRDRRPIPVDVTSLSMARHLAPTRSDIPALSSFEQLSAGQRLLFSYLGPLVFRDRSPDVVLIDEVERHLHPEWIMRLIPALRSVAPDAQFFVATHSPQVVSGVPAECIRILRREQGVVSAVTPTASRGRDMNLILATVLGSAERPPTVKKELDEYFELLNEERFDEANELRTRLESEIEGADAEFARADAYLALTRAGDAPRH